MSLSLWWREWLSADSRAAAPGWAETVHRDARAWTRRHAAVVDVTLAVAAAAGTVPQLVHHARAADPQLPAYLLFSALLVVPLSWRRRWPLSSFAFVSAVALAQWIVGVELAADVVLLIFLYTVASRYPTRVAVLSAGVVEVGALLAALRWERTGSWADTFVLTSGLVVASLMLGMYVRQQHNALSILTHRAQQLERERDQQAVIAAVEERTRIAREMHDVVAHSLSVMVTLSEGAARKQSTEPDRAGTAMRQVSTTGRQALDEMRRLLGVLRTGDAMDSRQPQPGFAQLDGLLDQVRATGLAATLTVTGTPATMPPGLELTVYRVVQEALTNALKHADGLTRVSVAIAHGPDLVTVDVHDNGTSRPKAGALAGHGLAGMRERAAVYDGTVSAGPQPDGGWRVHVDLPVPTDARVAQ
ncbi:sensor histidine kinase [Kribbella sp. NBC_00359]|uniref:sensor histidine kinase n=1 Tax=Kribbella sp. NBC_00359 TaxID=2975966 RepID=UPI002E211A49